MGLGLRDGGQSKKNQTVKGRRLKEEEQNFRLEAQRYLTSTTLGNVVIGICCTWILIYIVSI